MPKDDWNKNTIYKILMEAKLWPWHEDEIETVLDVACGLSLKSKFIPAKVRVGVDIYDKYFEHIEADVPFAIIRYDVRRLNEIFLPKSFDLVIALDIIEHLEKEESLKMMFECERIAKKAVILETPKGFIPQDLDITGHSGHEYQTHRCGWEREELESMGYKVIERPYTMSNVQRNRDESLYVDPNVTLLDAIKFI